MSEPSGWLPFCGCSNCCGSPSRTRLFPAGAQARTLASDIWPASSTKRTSTESLNSSRDQSHGVPPSTFTAPLCKSCSASSFVPISRTGRLSEPSPSVRWAQVTAATFISRAACQDLIQQLANDLVTDCRDSHLLSVIYQLADHASASERLTRAWRPLNGKHGMIQRQSQPPGRIDGRLISPRSQRLSSGEPGRVPQAGDPVLPG